MKQKAFIDTACRQNDTDGVMYLLFVTDTSSVTALPCHLLPLEKAFFNQRFEYFYAFATKPNSKQFRIESSVTISLPQRGKVAAACRLTDEVSLTPSNSSSALSLATIYTILPQEKANARRIATSKASINQILNDKLGFMRPKGATLFAFGE